jgi:hypothetical protein
LLEKCISEDPIHERALLLLSDCLLASTGGRGRAVSQNTRIEKTKKKKLQIETEIKTILEMEEEEEEQRRSFLSKNVEQNLFLSRTTATRSPTNSQHRDENEK